MLADNQKFLAQIGKWKYPEKKFAVEKVVLFKQTNVIGNTYFSNYIEWQGEVRERFFLSHPAAPMFLQANPNIMLITHSLSHRFINNSFFGDVIRIELTTKNILEYSVVMIFRYFNAQTNKLIGEGWQKVCFMDRNQNIPCKVPQIFLDLAISVREG